MLTNLPVEISADRYQGQEAVERRYSMVTGPVAVAPMFGKNNRRSTALITVIRLAVLVFCRVERAVRHAIAPATKLERLQVRRPAQPTGTLIVGALANLRLVPATAGHPAFIPQPGPLQAHLLRLLDVDPTPT